MGIRVIGRRRRNAQAMCGELEDSRRSAAPVDEAAGRAAKVVAVCAGQPWREVAPLAIPA